MVSRHIGAARAQPLGLERLDVIKPVGELCE